MKTYSNDAITKMDVEKVAFGATRMSIDHADELDRKQTVQIGQLRIWLAVSFAVNVALTLALHFL